jgi:hypothetical protein
LTFLTLLLYVVLVVRAIVVADGDTTGIVLVALVFAPVVCVVPIVMIWLDRRHGD